MHFTKTIGMASLIAASVFCTTAAQADRIKLSGRWLMPNGAGVIVIRKNRWFHPKFGAATIKRGKGSADYEIHYHKHQGTRCAYRMVTTAFGELLNLEVADETQSADFCPSGQLQRVSN